MHSLFTWAIVEGEVKLHKLAGPMALPTVELVLGLEELEGLVIGVDDEHLIYWKR